MGEFVGSWEILIGLVTTVVVLGLIYCKGKTTIRKMEKLSNELKFEYDQTSGQTTFYIQPGRVAVNNHKFLWLSQKVELVHVNERRLPRKLLPRKQTVLKRTFRRRVKEPSSLYRVVDKTNAVENRKSISWNPVGLNTSDRQLLVFLADDNILSSIMSAKASSQYAQVAKNGDFDATFNSADASTTSKQEAGVLAKLVYITERLTYVKETDMSNIFEVSPVNVKLSYEPAVVWAEYYESMHGLSTSHFQVSEKFGQSCEKRVLSVTTRGKKGFFSSLSLSLNEVSLIKNLYRKTEPVKELVYEDIPDDVVVIDKVDNGRNQDDQENDDDDSFEDLCSDKNDEKTFDQQKIINKNNKASSLKQVSIPVIEVTSLEKESVTKEDYINTNHEMVAFRETFQLPCTIERKTESFFEEVREKPIERKAKIFEKPVTKQGTQCENILPQIYVKRKESAEKQIERKVKASVDESIDVSVVSEANGLEEYFQQMEIDDELRDMQNFTLSIPSQKSIIENAEEKGLVFDKSSRTNVRAAKPKSTVFDPPESRLISSEPLPKPSSKPSVSTYRDKAEIVEETEIDCPSRVSDLLATASFDRFIDEEKERTIFEEFKQNLSSLATKCESVSEEIAIEKSISSEPRKIEASKKESQPSIYIAPVKLQRVVPTPAIKIKKINIRKSEDIPTNESVLCVSIRETEEDIEKGFDKLIEQELKDSVEDITIKPQTFEMVDDEVTLDRSNFISKRTDSSKIVQDMISVQTMPRILSLNSGVKANTRPIVSSMNKNRDKVVESVPEMYIRKDSISNDPFRVIEEDYEEQEISEMKNDINDDIKLQSREPSDEIVWEKPRVTVPEYKYAHVKRFNKVFPIVLASVNQQENKPQTIAPTSKPTICEPFLGRLIKEDRLMEIENIENLFATDDAEILDDMSNDNDFNHSSVNFCDSDDKPITNRDIFREKNKNNLSNEKFSRFYSTDNSKSNYVNIEDFVRTSVIENSLQSDTILIEKQMIKKTRNIEGILIQRRTDTFNIGNVTTTFNETETMDEIDSRNNNNTDPQSTPKIRSVKYKSHSILKNRSSFIVSNENENRREYCVEPARPIEKFGSSHDLSDDYDSDTSFVEGTSNSSFREVRASSNSYFIKLKPPANETSEKMDDEVFDLDSAAPSAGKKKSLRKKVKKIFMKFKTKKKINEEEEAHHPPQTQSLPRQQHESLGAKPARHKRFYQRTTSLDSYLERHRFFHHHDVVKSKDYTPEVVARETERELDYVKEQRRKKKLSIPFGGSAGNILETPASKKIGKISVPGIFSGVERSNTEQKNSRSVAVGKLNIPQAFSCENIYHNATL